MKQHLHAWMFAADGKWEEALIVDATMPIDIQAVLAWVNEAPQNVAFEAEFAERPGEPNTMFGVRITPLSKAEQANRVEAILEVSTAIKCEDDFLHFYQRIFPDFALFGQAPDALNIGVVGAWFSVGEETLWRNGQEPLNATELKAQAPRFFERRTKPTAIEAWYTKPLDHWYKIYVTEPKADSFEFSELRYNNALKVFREKFLCLS